MSDAKRPDPKRRSPTSRPGRPDEAKGKPRKATKAPSPAAREPASARKEQARPAEPRALPEPIEEVRESIAASAELQSDQRLGFTARRAAILAAVVCVLTLTIAGPVRTYFAQRTEMKQLAATEAALRSQIADLQEQKDQLGDPVFIAAQARERLGFVMPGDVPYQVQLPPSADVPAVPGAAPALSSSNDPWYAALWKTIADTPHGAPTPSAPVPPADVPGPPPPVPGQPGG